MTTTLTDEQQERRHIAEENLRAQIQRRIKTTKRPDQENAAPPEQSDPAGIDVRPANAYEAITRQMVESLSADLQEIKSRLNNLLFMIAGAILLDVIGRMIGT